MTGALQPEGMDGRNEPTARQRGGPERNYYRRGLSGKNRKNRRLSAHKNVR